MCIVGYANGKFLWGEKKMWNGYDYAAIEAVLGRGITWSEECEEDVTFLADRMCSIGLTHKEQTEYDALQALYESGR